MSDLNDKYQDLLLKNAESTLVLQAGLETLIENAVVIKDHFKEVAKIRRSAYLSFVKEGFSKNESFQMAKEIMK
jgi:hypothetical protein